MTGFSKLKLRKWRFKRHRLTDAHGLIWASTGLAGDFSMQHCTYLIWYHHVKLPWVEVRKVIKRYREHVAFWNFGLDVIRSELKRFAEAVCYPYNVVANEFDALDTSEKITAP